MDTEPRPRRAINRTWIEILVAAAALIVSAASLVVAIETADANKALVAASTWPFLQLESSNTDEQNRFRITLAMTNSGVGPAKLETFEVFWHGKPYATSFALLTECCGLKPPTAPPGAAEGQADINTAPAATLVLRAGETRQFFSFTPGNQPDVWHRFDRVRFSELKVRACYCSVFDECWMSDLRSLRPSPVSFCRKPEVSYVE